MSMSPVELSVVVAYALLLGVLSVYGGHRYYMVYLYYRHKYRLPTAPRRFGADELPRVTVQLPIFNEMYVIERLVGAVAKIRYPRHLLDVQILDDSTDETVAIARACAERFRADGLDIVHIHRVDRTGFKAGALENGLRTSKGELVAVFDADFVPGPDFLERTVDQFTDAGVGMVQTRWGHINADYSSLTRVQSVLLDGHFVVEHTARNRADRFFNFNGTAGIWRRKAIDDAGGWEHDTLTEDTDLSYRSQAAGWRFVYLKDIVVPAELPVEMTAFKAQQHRWAKGLIQVAMKLLPRLLRSDLPWEIRKEAFFHLTSNVAYLLMIPLAILLPVTVVVRVSHGALEVLLLDLPFFAAATFSVVFFYAASQRELGRRWWEWLPRMPLVLAVGIGLSINNARAVVEALMGYQTAFVRTPKHGVKGSGESVARKRYKAMVSLQPLVELAMAAYMTYGVVYLIQRGVYYSLPFLVLFQVGFGYVALVSIWEHTRGLFGRFGRVPQPAPTVE
jgi:cellulose synthase/poly-beta-1,6-N-acetylglucosamine synthase-like glycosyltransferase